MSIKHLNILQQYRKLLKLSIGLLIALLVMVLSPSDAYAQQGTGKSRLEKSNDSKNRKNRRKKRKGDKAKYAGRNVRENSRRVRNKQGDRAVKGDITGRRVKTKTSPRRNSAGFPQPDPYAGRKRSTEASRTKSNRDIVRQPSGRSERFRRGDISGKRIRTRSSSARGRRVYNSFSPSYLSASSGGEKGGGKKKKRISPRSASGGFRVSKRVNPYAGRGRRKGTGERAVTKDIAGRKLRKNNSRARRITTPSFDPYVTRKRTGDKPYSGRLSGGAAGRSVSRKSEGTYKGRALGGGARSATRRGERTYRGRALGGGARSATRRSERTYQGRPLGGGARSASRRGERAFTKDIAGRKLRKNNTKRRQIQAQPTFDPYFGKSRKAGSNEVAGKRTKNQRRRLSATTKNRNNRGRAIITKPPGDGTRKGFRFQGNIKSGRPLKGGGSVTAKLKRNNRGRPVATKPPGRGTLRGGQFQGNVKGGKPLKGGGSVTARLKRNNRGRPVATKPPGKGTLRGGQFQGNIKGGKPLKGGGSITARLKRNNKGQPVATKPPGKGTLRGGQFQGNIKGGKPLKGGGSITARMQRSNRGKPIATKPPGKGTLRGGQFQGNIKGGKPLKGGGSISGKLWNNREQALNRRPPSGATQRATRFAGNLRGNRRLKGAGGSVSGKLWNNQEQALQKKLPGRGTRMAVRFQGNIKGGKPLKGGGSVKRGQWNNRETPLQKKYTSSKILATSRFSGKTKQRRGYRRNPNAAEDALLKKSPNRNTFRGGSFQGNLKGGKPLKGGGGRFERGIWNNDEKPLKRGYANPETIYAAKFTGRFKLRRKYQKNPKTPDDALKGIGLTKEARKGGNFQGRFKVAGNYKKKPNAPDGALKGIAPFKAAAKARDYQGNIKMKKGDTRHMHPSSTYTTAKKRRNSLEEKDKVFKFRIWWASLFKKNDNQPEYLKEKDNSRRPRYDKREEGLWYD
ncbi:MAG: hypothetical protein AAFX87_28020 [Bacteroidota bacterium]